MMTLFCVNEVKRFEMLERLAIAVEIGLEIDIAGRTTFAVTLTRLVNAHRDKAATREIGDQPTVRPCPSRNTLD